MLIDYLAACCGVVYLDAAIEEEMVFTAVRTAWNQGQRLVVTYRETITDEDRLTHYKLFANRFEVEG